MATVRPLGGNMDTRCKRLPRRPENIFEYLHREHLTATALLERLIDGCDAASIRDELFFELERQLTVHAMAEEHTFYSALRVADDTRFKVRRAVAEHGQIEELLNRLAALRSGEPPWLDTLRALQDLVVQHIVDESEIFEAARHVLTPADARALAVDMEAEERRLDSGMTGQIAAVGR